MKNALIMFCKNPEEIPCKTRLAKEIGKERAIQIYKQCLSKLIKNHSNQEYDFFLYIKGSKNYFLNNYKLTENQIKQSTGNTLEEDLTQASQTELQQYNKIVIIGSDLPTLDSKDIQETLGSLDKADVVLGPATDGGYYLVALKETHNIFNLNSWSHNNVLKETINIIKELNLSCILIEEKRDIDTKEDLQYYPELSKGLKEN